MIIHVFDQPIPVHSELGDGYLLYVKSNGMFENDEFMVVLKEGGELRHMLTSQFQIASNSTYQIIKKTPA